MIQITKYTRPICHNNQTLVDNIKPIPEIRDDGSIVQVNCTI